jgi:hypothetical protein
MTTAKTKTFLNIAAVLITLSLLFSGCASGQTTEAPYAAPSLTEQAVNPTLAQTATATLVPLAVLSLQPGDFYFSIDGKPTFILSRNPTGKTETDFDTVLDWAHLGGTRVIRVHLTHGWWGDAWINQDWSVNEKWAQNWDHFFDEAQADGIYVIPVFGVWADWNNGTPDWGSSLWQYNPLNTANGGPVTSPGDLFTPESDTQKHWMEWVKTLVQRWQGQENIAAWEIFSEIDIASGAAGHMYSTGSVDEATGIAFTDEAMSLIKGADKLTRPVTLSLSGVYSSAGKWNEYYNLDSLDFIEVHYYSDKIDRDLVSQVRKYLTKYQKPVLIGECGLWSMVHNENAEVGIRHAIWAGMVSGAMNGRALWDQDGYYIYTISNRISAMEFMQTYAKIELPVVNFTKSLDFSGFQPITAKFSSGVWGAAIGNETMILGWYRDATIEPPDWNMKSVVSKQTVNITVPGTATEWRINFYNTRTGTDIISSTLVTRKGDQVTITLPDFTDDIAFKLFPK